VGLDSLRFVCALVVVLGHYGLFPLMTHGNEAHGAAKIATGLVNCLFNGPAAVIVFFVVSGFCIHYPFRKGRPVIAATFYARRFIRIVPPALVFILLMKLLRLNFISIQQSVLWSIICETIYYLIYPALSYLRRWFRWEVMIGAAYAAVALEIATHLGLLKSSNNEYVAFGWATWTIGLPCWLLGCWLAERYQSFAALPSSGIWLLRVVVFAMSVLARLAMFHISSPLASNCILLDLFAIPVCYWVGAEVSYFKLHSPLSLLERAGRWSYSLYLVHPLVGGALALAGMASLARNPKAHVLVIAIVLVASYAFYLVIEGPCHRLAVLAGRRIARANAPLGDNAQVAHR
jgi:peptidoglycan/LPS O-acetylase OafA/YrhL